MSMIDLFTPSHRHGLRNLIIALLAIVVVAGIAIVAVVHATHNESGSSNVQSIRGPLDSVSVSGRIGAIPVVTMGQPVTVNLAKAKVLETGTGREITKDSPILLAITSFDGKTGENLSADGRPDLVVGSADQATLNDALLDIVVGLHEGSRVLVAHPLASSQGEAAKTSDQGTELLVIDILYSIANGSEDTGESSGVLSVTMTDEGPVIEHGSDVPTDVTTQILIKGEGQQVTSSDQIVVQYAAVGWNDGVVRASTWQTGKPEVVSMLTAMTGLKQTLVDQRVGSRLAISIPPDLANGDDTLCIVIDILGTEPASDNASQSDASAEHTGVAPSD